jgi:serine/threonine protein kinase
VIASEWLKVDIFTADDQNGVLLYQILLGLHFLHTNEHRILHRDISLCNILRVLQKGEDGKPDGFIHKLSDLGVARVSVLDTDDI